MKKSGGVVIKKKNSFQRHKNAEAERKKAQEQEEAKVLAEFQETFGASQEQVSSAKPQRPKPGPRAVMPPTGMGMGMGMPKPPQPSGVAQQAPGIAAAAQPPSQRRPELPASKGGTRQIDLLTEKLKGEKVVREDRMRVLGAVGMAHLAAQEAEPDTSSTNLYVTNLYRTVTEDVLMETFGRYGPLASVKIMWPRSEEERAVKIHNSGFVGFMARKHAEAAVQNLHGSMLHGSELKVGFGKAIPIPPQPIYPRPQHVQHLHNHMSSVAHSVANAGQQKTWGRGEEDEKVLHRGCGKAIHVEFPKEERVRFVIDTLARFIIEDGTDMEQALLEAEASNPEFEFLRNVHCPEHMYYRWKLYSLCNEDGMAQWRTDPFVMIEDSNRIHPPPLHRKSFQSETAAQRGSVVGARMRRKQAGGPGRHSCSNISHNSAAGAERERDVQLSDLEREKLEDMLRQLKVERANIQAAMVFALDHASCATEISDCLVASLTLSETPLHLKTARLYLASDILHNSTVPVRNASRYRQLLQAELPAVFLSFHDALLSAAAALKREAFKRNSLRVLRVWRDWYLFSEDYLNGLQATFLMETDLKWRGLCPDQLKEWTEMSVDDLERTCKMMGVLFEADDREACLDRLVMQHIFSLFGVHGPPASLLEALVGSKQEEGGMNQGASVPATKLGLLAAYESDSDGEEASKAANKDQGKASDTSGGSRWATDSTVPLKDKEIQEKAQQWEQIDEEPEAVDEKPLSQWLLEKQAKAAAEAEHQRREEAMRRAAMQQEAQERLRQLEEEEREAEEKLRQGLSLEDGEALPDRPARQRLEQQQSPAQQADVSNHAADGSAPGSNAAGLTPDEHRKQLREVELRVVELQEELLEEAGWQAGDVQRRCNELRVRLRARIDAGDLLDSDVSRSITRREDLDWALQRTSSKQQDTQQNRHETDARGGSGSRSTEQRDSSSRGRRRHSPSEDRGGRHSDRDEGRRDSRSSGHKTSDAYGGSSRHKGQEKGDDSHRPSRYRRDGGTEERDGDGRYSRSHRDDGERYRRERSRDRGRDRDSDRGNRSWEDDRDSKRAKRR